MRRLFYVVLCVLALFTVGCGNSDKTAETETEKSYSEKLGKEIGDSINDIKQSAQDATDATQENLDKTQEMAESIE